MATYISLSEGEENSRDVKIFCKYCRDEVLPEQPHRAINDPDCPGKLAHFHEGPPGKPCWEKWHDDLRKRISADPRLQSYK